ncbi:dihydroorotase [Chitinophagaceae bacterium MMS25-I14]
MRVLIRQARVTDPKSHFHNQVVDILIEEGIITEIASAIHGDADTVYEVPGLHVSRGWTDIFADYREPGYEHKETITSGLAAAAAGGFTHVMVTPNTHPAVSDKTTVQYILSKALGNPVHLYPLGTVSQEAEGKQLAEMLDMYTHGAVAFTDGWKTIQNSGLMLKALEYVKAFDGIVIQIPVDASLSAGGLMHEGPVSTQLGMAGIPDLAETLLVHRDIELLRYTGSKLHLTGISAAASVDMIRKAKAEGLQITCSVTPYHLALTDESLRTYDSLYKVSPPLRSEADRQALIAGLKDGTIDCIASHHRPQEWDAKAKEFEYSSDGMNVQEIAFSIVWDAVKGTVPLERVIDAFTKGGEIFGLEQQTVNKGSMAELTIFTTEETVIPQKENKKSLSANHPFFGKELAGNVIDIITK